MANLNILAKVLGTLGDALTPPLAGAARGALLAPAIEGQALSNAQQRQAFPLELQGMQQRLEAERNALTRPTFHPLGQGHVLVQTPDGRSEIITLAPQAPTGAEQARIAASKATQESAEATKKLRERELAKLEAPQAAKEHLNRDALAAIAGDPSRPVAEREQAKAMLASIEASHKRTSALEMGGGLSPAAVEMEAESVAKGAPMTSLGMGSAKARFQILDRAAQILAQSGDDAGSLALRRLAYGGANAEIKRIQSQRGPIASFIRTTRENLKAAEDISATVERGQAPVFNRWVLAGRKQVQGDPRVSKFDIATKTAVDEYAKVILSATGSGQTAESARKKVEEMLNIAQTPQQFRDVAQFMREEMDRRLKGYEDQLQSVYDIVNRGRPGEPGPAPTPSAPSAPTLPEPPAGSKRVR